MFSSWKLARGRDGLRFSPFSRIVLGPGEAPLAVDVHQGGRVGQGAEQGGLRQPLAPGVIEDVDIKDTIDVALALQPQVKKIVVINDETAVGKANKQLLLRNLVLIIV